MNHEHDLAYLRLAVPDLEEFLLSKEVFWPLPSAPREIGQPGLEQLSLGFMRLCLVRVQAGKGGAEAARLADKVAELRGRWRSNWSKKAMREFGVRTGQWRRALEELHRDPGALARDIRLRVILELLREDMLPGDQPQELPVLVGLDQILSGSGASGPFLWDEKLISVFPDPQYWFLYWQMKPTGSAHVG